MVARLARVTSSYPYDAQLIALLTELQRWEPTLSAV